MTAVRMESELVYAGDVDGRGKIYSVDGGLILLPGETMLRVASNWDLDVISPWRRIMPKVVFPGFNGRATSRLYITDQRIALIRQVDSWREVKGDMTPLGIPNAIARKAQLDAFRASGVLQFCQIRPSGLRVVTARRRAKPNSWLSMRLKGTDGAQYAIMIWKSDGVDEETLNLVASQFLH